MLEPNWKQKRPTKAEIKRMWDELEVIPEQIDSQTLEKLLYHLRETHVNGGAEFFAFRLKDHPTFHWFGSRNRLEEINFITRFLNLPIVSENIVVINPNKSLISETEFEWASSFVLDGELAETLIHGGAYHKFNGSGITAKKLTMSFCEEIFGNRYLEIQMYKSYRPFTDWFYDVAWDVTWLGFDKRNLRVWLLCLTDTD